MISKSSVPRAEGRDSVLEAVGGVAREFLVVKVAFEYSAILKNNAGANDTRVSVVRMDGAAGPKILGHVVDASDFVGILVVLEAVSYTHLALPTTVCVLTKSLLGSSHS